MVGETVIAIYQLWRSGRERKIIKKGHWKGRGMLVLLLTSEKNDNYFSH